MMWATVLSLQLNPLLSLPKAQLLSEGWPLCCALSMSPQGSTLIFPKVRNPMFIGKLGSLFFLTSLENFSPALKSEYLPVPWPALL